MVQCVYTAFYSAVSLSCMVVHSADVHVCLPALCQHDTFVSPVHTHYPRLPVCRPTAAVGLVDKIRPEFN